jgi:PAS domain S-box-containing protein
MPASIFKNEYDLIFDNSPSAMLIIDTDAPLYTILDVNKAYLNLTNSTREQLLGKPVFGAFPANPTDEVSKNIERTIFSFEQAISTKKTHTMSNYRYDIPVRGTDLFEERYWTTSNIPILNNDGHVKYFIHSPVNVTELNQLAVREKAGIKALKTQRQQLYSTFMQAPVGIAIFHGPNHVVDLINPPLCKIYGKPIDEILNKPVFEVLNHTRGLGFEERLDHVRLTGQTFKGQEVAAPLVRNDKLETVYLNIVYEPFRENDGTISGVIVIATEVTEQVNARQRLEEAEERTRLAVDAVGLGTFDYNLITGEMVTSEKFAGIWGYDSPLPHHKYIKAIHPDDISIYKLAHEKAIKTGILTYEARVIRPDSSTRWVKADGKVYYNKRGTATRMIGTLLDITEQRQAREEQQKLLTLVANSVDLMSVLGMDGINTYINDAGRNMLGFENEEQVLNTPISELHAPQDFDLVQQEVLPTVMNEGRWAGRMLVKHLQTGEIFPVYNNCIRINDPVTGNVIGVGAVMRDMRPELASKQALADSEQLLRNITTASPTGLWMSDEHGAFTYTNQTWIDWTGISFEDNLGEGWLGAIIPEDKEKSKAKFLNDLANRKRCEVECRINHTDSTIRWCVITGRPQYRSEGTFAGYIGAVTDITEQKALQQQKDDFIGIASHELKTPVTSIKAYAQVLEKMLEKKGEAREAGMIRKMDGQLNRLTSLIGDLLDVTKINSGKLKFNNHHFDFNAHVKDLIEDLQRTTDNHTLIEQLTPTGIVFGDKERIGQVVTNLITNAIKYSPQADKVIITSALTDDEVVLSVQDFGIGIAEQNLCRVFEQFYRVSGDIQHTFPGLGLGLYISAEIIKREGGRIWVNSKEGEGSTFYFALPGKR